MMNTKTNGDEMKLKPEHKIMIVSAILGAPLLIITIIILSGFGI